MTEGKRQPFVLTCPVQISPKPALELVDHGHERRVEVIEEDSRIDGIVNEKALAIMKDESISYAEALRKVFDRKPELRDLYFREMATTPEPDHGWKA